MPGGAADVCNDIAVDTTGAAYITETRVGRIYRLSPGASALEPWAEDPRFAGADGLAFGADGALVFNTVTTHRLFRIQRRADGGAGDVTELTPTLPLQRPDGLRAIEGGRFIMAEAGAGRVTEFTIAGGEARMRALGGVSGTTAVTFARGRVWAVNAKLAHRNDPALGEPGPFEVYSLRLD
jgi:sugar lactone lactonase YvrE